jgi:hypothetical protein
MKKTLASITIICYLAASSGVIINFHYCMGRVDSVKLFASNSNLCSHCGMHLSKTHKCCGNEIKVIKLKDDQQNAQAIHSFKAPAITVTIPSDFIVTSFYNADKSFYRSNHSPHLLTEQDTYLQNRIFRI